MISIMNEVQNFDVLSVLSQIKKCVTWKMIA